MKDRFGREIDYLRISVTDKCNLRCRYCMPEDGVQLLSHKEVLTIDEYLKIVAIFQKKGIRKIRLTGGEPLVKKGILDLIKGIRDLGIEEIAMTTNGVLLGEKARDLKKAGLDRVNISLDTLDPEKFKELTRGGDLQDVLGGIRACQKEGLEPVKINTVLVKGFNDKEVSRLISWAGEEKIILRFIELMPIGEAIQYKDQQMFFDQWNKGDFEPLPGKPLGGPARYYRHKSGATVGFINPVSCQFCEDCNRLRLDCKGNLILCLHSTEKINLKKPLRTGEDVEKIIDRAILEKPESHHLNEGQYNPSQMNTIGG
ncbi:MAG: GTP 3',8-cyclase MoaA [Tissierellia bacterium]|nr:GTP 3',8-cyclase MoaA [Tissierellia bacterium]